MRARAAGLALCLIAGLGVMSAARAEMVLHQSVRPVLRPQVPAVTAPGLAVPVPRPEAKAVLAAAPRPPLLSVVPLARPALPAPREQVVRAGLLNLKVPNLFSGGGKGQLCGTRGIEGERLSPIVGRIKACGIEAPVKVTAVGGVTLSPAAVMDCTTAAALLDWVETSAKPQIGRLGGGLAGLRVADSYSCRPRNNQAGEKISEHGKGRAIDISAFILKNGSSMSVLKGWGDKAQGKILKAMHKSACGPFGTVLGPAANAAHRDHFHFDTARYRGGSYCR